MNLNLAGLSVVVTGGTHGIGAAIVETMASEGCDVAFCSRSEANVQHMLNILEPYPVKKTPGVIDVTNIADFTQWLATVGTIDIFVPNVSALSPNWDVAIDTDLRATVQTSEAVIPYLEKSSHAAITYIGSKAATFATPGFEAYGATKAAMRHYMKSLSKRLTSKGVRVNVVSPGDTFVEGGFWDNIRLNAPDVYQATLDSNPMGRFCTPQEVANAVAFLSSPSASFITGSHLLVDGGSTTHIHG
ncbi:3-ketoacyl-CoA reductase [Acidithiobacillus ferrivorans]|uniref:3-ketoacyl-CoA reductase n=1 Tax=Acidithiobacillus ferrivorans TaxID=160808 RepID=A0A060UYE4_9PROT|nr:SDR family oxidoreductase [Acidithiobacillus ferrivorans]CDQ11738.1 Short-chain dehydrogenase/reductase SDR [Acidithiobacillus ferrivorans]SMH67342.1 3-ketoacyl-CoA reductase [Acidithiobacillus ferrivorans]